MGQQLFDALAAVGGFDATELAGVGVVPLLPGGRIDALSDAGDSTTLQYSFLRLGEDGLAELTEGFSAISSGIESHVSFLRVGDL